MNAPGGYVNFLMPGIIGQTAAFASFGTAIALAMELQKGVIDRLRSMPMARGAVLAGRLVADTARIAVTILIIIGVGYAAGFRFSQRRGSRDRHGRAGRGVRPRDSIRVPSGLASRAIVQDMDARVPRGVFGFWSCSTSSRGGSTRATVKPSSGRCSPG